MDDRFHRALAAIDALHAADPETWEVGGRREPRALAHARCVTRWTERLCETPSEALRLAARAAHLERWKVPRTEYPDGRRGYLKWRSVLKRRHAARAAEVLAEAGYEAETIERVRRIVLRADLSDPEAQALEDALCLTFLERQLADFGGAHAPEKVVEILRKTWKKMSPRARALALGLAPELPAGAKALLEQALDDAEPGTP